MRKIFFILSLNFYLFILLGLVFTNTVSAQTNGVSVVFYGTDKKDSVAFFGGDKSALTGIHSNVIMDGKVILVNKDASGSSSATTAPCASAILDGKEGANVLFLGSEWENGENNHMSGIGYITFMGTVKQDIKNRNGNNKVTDFPGLQLNNNNDVYLQGEKGIRISNKINFFAGKLHVSKDTVTFGKNVIPTCDDKKSYIQLAAGTTNGIVAKDTGTSTTDTKFRFRFPIGSDKSYSPLVIVMPKSAGNGSSSGEGKILARFDNVSPVTTDKVLFPNQLRYDKGGNSFWTVKTTLDHPKVDSVYVGIEKKFAKTEVSDNFRRSRALITQYVSKNEINNYVLTSGSNWDRPIMTETELRPEVINISKAGTKTTIFQYKRGGGKTSKDSLKVVGKSGGMGDYSFYTVANYDDHTLITRFDSTNFSYDNTTCQIKTDWLFKDKFVGQEYVLELTSDTLNDNATKTIVPINENMATVDANNVYSYNVSLLDVPPDIFTNTEPVYARVLERDFGGKTFSLASQAFLLQCNVGHSEESVPLVSVTSSSGGTQMILQYDAVYPEEIELSVWNILGQREIDLGHRSVNPGRNNLIFNLPVSITRNQRYVLLITGGVLNEKVKTYSLTFVVK